MPYEQTMSSKGGGGGKGRSGGGGGGNRNRRGGGGGGGGNGGGNNNNKASLNPSTKEFVPTSQLKASAAAWQPTPSGGGGGPAKHKAPPAAQPPNPNAKPAPPSAPVAGAWGKKGGAASAVRAAPTAPIQPAASSAAQRSQQPQHQQKPQGGGGGDGGAKQWRKGGHQQPQQQQKPQGGGGGSWARATKQGGGGGKGGGATRRGSSGGGKGGGDQGGDDGGWQRGKSLPLELLKPGEGSNEKQKAVTRMRAEDLLALRMSYVAPPLSWGEGEEGSEDNGPPEACAWTSPSRVTEIDSLHKGPRMGGDVSAPERRKKKVVETAPPLEECKPLEVNEETRWKAGVFDKSAGKGDDKENEESTEDILKKALLVLNKLSLTKFDKLSDAFIDTGIGRNEECLAGAIGLIVEKAQEEHHFAAMYAALCLKLARTPMEQIEEGSKKGKKFKKMLLSRCQEEFEKDQATKIEKATEGIEDEEERQYRAGLIKKHYLGHMRFIGELYKGDLISIKIMLFCLPALLEGDTTGGEGSAETPTSGDDEDEVDEEKVECFAKLMTVIGSSLEQQSEAMKSVGKVDASEKLAECWRTVEIMAGKRKEKGPHVSNRMKFMLQDLIEMRDKGWVTRRKEETAKTIAQIHKEVAKEEARSARRSSSSANLRGSSSSSSLRRSNSGDVRNLGRQSSKPQVDKDGFVSVSSGMGRSMSMNAISRSSSGGFQQARGRGSRGNLAASMGEPSKGKKGAGGVRRTNSGSAFAALNEASGGGRKSEKKDRGGSQKERSAERPAEKEKPKSQPPAAAEAKKEYKSPDECGEKAKNILKEYFVGGDTDDAVLSVHELVGAGDEGSVERGAKVVESAVLLVLEMKQEEVDKFLTVVLRCASEKKIEGPSFVSGLNDPLEFLSDIAIDAPLAEAHLATIVAAFVKDNVFSFDFLLTSPEYFRTDGNAAQFGAKVLKKIGPDAAKNDAYVNVVEKLMTDEDKSTYPSVQDLLAA